jgi:hypothetical protein
MVQTITPSNLTSVPPFLSLYDLLYKNVARSS